MKPTKKNFSILRTQESGAVLLEFTLILPVVLMIIFAGIEYTRSLRGLQFTTTISRESASIAFRECSADLPAKISGCLDLVRDRMEDFASEVEPGTEVILSLYENSSGTVSKLAESKRVDSNYTSRFSEDSESFTGASEILTSHKRLVVAETFVPISRLVKEILKFDFGLSEALYDATIL